MKVEFVLVRHGETDYNINKVIQGWKDIPLNDVGVQQAHITGNHLKSYPKFDLAWSSDLDRAIVTAKTILQEQNNEIPVMLDKRLRERSFGYYEGKQKEEYYKGLMHHTIEDGLEFQGRLVEFFEELPEKINAAMSANGENNSTQPLRILLSSHSGPCKQIIQVFSKMKEIKLHEDSSQLSYTKEELTTISYVPNCSCTEIECDFTSLNDSVKNSQRKKLYHYPTRIKYGKIRRAADDSFVPIELQHHVAGDESVVTSPINSPANSPVKTTFDNPTEQFASFDEQVEQMNISEVKELSVKA